MKLRDATPDVVAGTVTLWSHDTDDGPVSETDVPFAGQIFRTNHWCVNPKTDLI
ncbi:hypothetical protein BX286_4052 [Streptomyces sp. 3211.6]|uniref:hypothetical protein n=1 Tax=Streptomyces TaxID=1883 RepID=UPI000CB10858|nr:MULTISPECIES: hypothetical protein [Streptomyces]RKT06016.1 hypothetical protein BX286_4052 [Streptomyces sp. 3211.6]RPF46444.1 hypothetical protein EDD96_3016 [Streptomyces sp. Ag109_G2-6]